MPGDANIQRAVLDLLEPGQCLTMDELARRADITRRQISNGAACLITRGLVERVEVGCYQLTAKGQAARQSGEPLTSGPNGAHTAPRRPIKVTFRARLWKAMRATRSFTADELISLAIRDERDPLSSTHRYLSAMEKAGYILPTPRRKPGTALASNGYKHYILVRDTGPFAPVLSPKNNAIFDPNTRQYHPLDETGGDA